MVRIGDPTGYEISGARGAHLRGMKMGCGWPRMMF
jgi:hypothetical protein